MATCAVFCSGFWLCTLSMFDSKRVQTGLAPKPCFMTHIIASAFEGTEGREGRRTWGVDGELASPPHISFPKARSNVQLGPWQAKGKPWSKIFKLSILGAGGSDFSGGRGTYRISSLPCQVMHFNFQHLKAPNLKPCISHPRSPVSRLSKILGLHWVPFGKLGFEKLHRSNSCIP